MTDYFEIIAPDGETWCTIQALRPSERVALHDHGWTVVRRSHAKRLDGDLRQRLGLATPS